MRRGTAGERLGYRRYEADGQAAAWRRANLAFFCFIGLTVMIAAPAWRTMTELWLYSSPYGHGLLAGPIAALIALREARRPGAPLPRPWLAGYAPLSVAAAIWFVGVRVDAQLLQHAGLVAALAAAAALVYGRELAVRCRFALGFAFFMVPVGAGATPILQTAAAAGADALLNVIGVATSRAGHLLATDAGAFRVAPGCAGLGVVWACVMTAVLCGRYLLDRLAQRIALVAAAVCIAVAVNIARIAAVLAYAGVEGANAAFVEDHAAAGHVALVPAIALVVAAAFAISTLSSARGRRYAG
ncbi:MAG: exosortase/archaeosortase family protein [Pseudomonadota bacterium]